ncbi:hypothetical protein M8C21_008483 [Ambrosia artemisiifolia]|uniref:Luc7-like protein 3 n=1 Tax=Ambrosia artemisiifolia TaxID=4212 RepID=A0AAD5CUK7_AMBAR|nr:hypothetical protein M8C21_008483 [Ambrosia artemisiifolia]
MDAQRALLDELMSSARNLTEEEIRGHKEITWDDKEMCGFYMVKFCPHDLFVNTRSDLGLCPKIHDPKLKESGWEQHSGSYSAPGVASFISSWCQGSTICFRRKAPPDPLLGSGSFIDPNNKKSSRPTWLLEGWDMVLKKCTKALSTGLYKQKDPHFQSRVKTQIPSS